MTTIRTETQSTRRKAGKVIKDISKSPALDKELKKSLCEVINGMMTLHNLYETELSKKLDKEQ